MYASLQFGWHSPAALCQAPTTPQHLALAGKAPHHAQIHQITASDTLHAWERQGTCTSQVERVTRRYTAPPSPLMRQLTMPAMEGSVRLCRRQVTAPMERPHRATEDWGNLPLRKATAAVRSPTSSAPSVTHSPSDRPEPCTRMLRILVLLWHCCLSVDQHLMLAHGQSCRRCNCSLSMGQQHMCILADGGRFGGP